MAFSTKTITGIPKNTAYRLYGQVKSDDSKLGFDITSRTFKILISKDGGTWAFSTNSLVHITRSSLAAPTSGHSQSATSGWFYIDLTASEMNATHIIIQTLFNDNPGLASDPTGRFETVISTTTSTPISTEHEIDADEKIPAGDITVMQVLGLLAKRLKRGNYKI